MIRFGKLAATVTGIAALSVGLAACGDDSDSGGDSGSGGTLIHGTTDQPVSYDPAGSYDLPSYNVIFNVYQNLLQIPPGGNKAEPEARKAATSQTTAARCTSAPCGRGSSSPTDRTSPPRT